MLIEVHEVNESGFIIDNYLLTQDQIDEMRMNGHGHLLITENWGDQRIFTPKWDFEQEKWVEGLSPEEVEKKEKAIQEQNEPKPSKEEMNALALMEMANIIYGGSNE